MNSVGEENSMNEVERLEMRIRALERFINDLYDYIQTSPPTSEEAQPPKDLAYYAAEIRQHQFRTQGNITI